MNAWTPGEHVVGAPELPLCHEQRFRERLQPDEQFEVYSADFLHAMLWRPFLADGDVTNVHFEDASDNQDMDLDTGF